LTVLRTFSATAQKAKNPFSELVSFEKHQANIKYLQNAVDSAKKTAGLANYPDDQRAGRFSRIF